MAEFWPALKLNAMESGHVYGVPFQNSTPLLYYSVDAFKDAGLDPDHPPVTWDDWVADMKKLTKSSGGQTTRWGLMFPSTYDYCGWITSALAMANGGDYYNTNYGGEVYYNTPHHDRRGEADRRHGEQVARDAARRDRRQHGHHRVLPGPRGYDDPVYRIVVLRAAQHEDAVQNRVPAAQASSTPRRSAVPAC